MKPKMKLMFVYEKLPLMSLYFQKLPIHHFCNDEFYDNNTINRLNPHRKTYGHQRARKCVADLVAL